MDLLRQRREPPADKRARIARIQNQHLGAVNAIEGRFQLGGSHAVFGLSVAEQKHRLLPAGRIVHTMRGQVQITHVPLLRRAKCLLNQGGQLLDRGDWIRRDDDGAEGIQCALEYLLHGVDVVGGAGVGIRAGHEMIHADEQRVFAAALRMNDLGGLVLRHGIGGGPGKSGRESEQERQHAK